MTYKDWLGFEKENDIGKKSMSFSKEKVYAFVLSKCLLFQL